MKYLFECVSEECDGEVTVELDENEMFFGDSIDFGPNIFTEKNIADYGDYLSCQKCWAMMKLKKIRKK